MFLIFFFAWIIFNGNITAEIVILGLIISAVVFAFCCKFMDYSLKKEKKAYKKILMLLKYLVVLIAEIVKANILVSRMILTTREEMEPVMVKFHTKLKSDTLRVILANSITLTPGTITVLLEEGEYLVHCLDKSLAEGMEDSIFVKLLEKMEEE